MNDSFRTNVFVRFPPETIACACIYLAARKLQIALPNSPAWYLLFGAQESEIQAVCVSILQLYSWHKINVDELEKLVANLKKANVEAKLKAKERGGVNATPTIESQSATPEKGHLLSPMTRPDLRHLKSDDDKSNDSFSRNLVVHHRKRHSSRSRSNSRHKKSRPEYNSDKRSRSRSSSSRSPPRTTSTQSSKLNSLEPKYYANSRSDLPRNSRNDIDHRARDGARYVDKHSSSKEHRLPSRYLVDSKKRSPAVADKSRYSKYNLSPVAASKHVPRSSSLSPENIAPVIGNKKHSTAAGNSRHKNGGHKYRSRQRSRSPSKERRNNSTVVGRVKELDNRR